MWWFMWLILCLVGVLPFRSQFDSLCFGQRLGSRSCCWICWSRLDHFQFVRGLHRGHGGIVGYLIWVLKTDF